MYLSEKDLRLIDLYRKEFAADDECSAYHRLAPIEDVLRVWKENKDCYLRNLLDDNLIYEFLVEVREETTVIASAIRLKLYDPSSRMFKFAQAFNDWVYHQDSEISYELNQLIDPWALTFGIYEYNTCHVTLPNGKKLKIQNGCKPVRMLGKIAEAFNLEGFEEFRLEHSLLVNQKNLYGTLCLSIHPLDYMTMSDNDEGWDSCMSWTDIGDYRSGTIEMMTSKCVIVAYLKNDERDYCPKELRNYGWSWNSKRWRELYVVTEDVITNVRPYPFVNEDLTKIALNTLRDLAKKNLGWNSYTNKIAELPSRDEDLRFAFETGNMYNDFDNDDFINYGFWNPNLQIGTYWINYSGPLVCMYCGNQPDYMENSNLICDDCDNRVTCFNCGDRHPAEDMTYTEDGEYICNNCSVYCDFIDSLPYANITEIDVYQEDKKIGWINLYHYNDRHYSKPLFVEDFKFRKKAISIYSSYTHPYIDYDLDFTDMGRKAFEECIWNNTGYIYRK